MKIAVYTIAKNEEQFVERWYNSAKNADYLLIVDTGSSDNTITAAKNLGINVVSINVNPFRFDDARNVSLSLLPPDIDYCIALDMDEILVDGWRKHLEKVNPNTTRPRYRFVWNWNEDGSPGLEFSGTKIHSRNNYRWKHPVHEIVHCYSGQEIEEWIGLEIHHHADNSKSRGQYLPMLEMSVKEDPNDDRNSFYYARELFFYRMYDKAAEEFKRHLSLPSAKWAPERAQSMRYLAQCEPDNRLTWLIEASELCPDRREPYCDLAKYYYEKNMWSKCKEACDKTLSILEKPMDYLCEAEAWGWLPYDLKAIAEYNLGNYKEAFEAGQKAYSINPDERLASNLAYYKKAYKAEDAIM